MRWGPQVEIHVTSKDRGLGSLGLLRSTATPHLPVELCQLEFSRGTELAGGGIYLCTFKRFLVRSWLGGCGGKSAVGRAGWQFGQEPMLQS